MVKISLTPASVQSACSQFLASNSHNRASISLEGSTRSRQPRLGIVDTFQLDRQRQLVIIRRDSVEHLLLLGGTNDVVVESNIIRTIQAQPSNRETGAVTRVVATPQPATAPKSTGTTMTSATAELSFAPEPAPIYPTVPVASLEVSPPITAPNPADLAEIANRFQTSTAKPIVAEREATMPQATPIPFMPRPAPAPLPKEPEPVAVESPPESQPIIPAIERALPRVEMAEKSPEPFTHPIQSRDIGSLNDTLRQLLGRTRES